MNLSIFVFLITLIICATITECSSNADLWFLRESQLVKMRIPPDLNVVQMFSDLRQINAFEFDNRQKCAYLANRTHIERQCLDKQSETILIANDLKEVEAIAFDWLSNMLYFTDARGKIEVVETKKSNNTRNHSFMRRTIVTAAPNIQITGLVVHPPLGFLFWIQHGQRQSPHAALYRAKLDGSDVRVLIKHPRQIDPNFSAHSVASDIPLIVKQARLIEPRDLAIDYATKRVYWIDAALGCIASCNIDGKQFRTDIQFGLSRPFRYQITVLNDIVYWRRPTNTNSSLANEVVAQRVNDKNVTIIDYAVNDFYRDIHVYDDDRKLNGSNACSENSHNCQRLCVSMPNGEHRCLCPDGMHATENGQCDVTVCVGNDFKCIADGICLAS